MNSLLFSSSPALINRIVLIPLAFCNNVCTLCVGDFRSGGYPGGPPMGGMGPGGPYNPPQGANPSRMNLQGPPYSTMPSGKSSDSISLVHATHIKILKIYGNGAR